MGIFAQIDSFWLYLLALVALLLLSAFFSGSETAFCALSRAKVRRLRDSAGRSGRAVDRLLSVPGRLFMTVLVGNTLVNVALSSIIAALAMTFLPASGIYLAIIVSTFLLLVFGEITPKTFAVHNAEAVSLFTAGPLLWFSRLILPVRFLLGHAANLVFAVLGLGKMESKQHLTTEEFEAVLHDGQAEGILAEPEAKIIRRIFELGQIDAKEIMIPRTRIIAAEQHAKISDLIQLAKRVRRWRIPIYQDDIDNITSVFYFKDLPAYLENHIEDLTVEQFIRMRDQMANPPHLPLIRPVFLVPQSQWIDVLLGQMRQKGAHLAILLDEFGGTAGMVTLEDILEEIVGEPFDSQQDDELIKLLQDQGLRLLGRSRIREINRRFDLDLPTDESDTIGGYVMSLFGDLPTPGQSIDDGKLAFRVLKTSGRSVDAVLLRRLADPKRKNEEDSSA